MRMSLTFITFLVVLLWSGEFYSLEGRWDVKAQYLPANMSMSISFGKELNDTYNRIQYVMNIFACKLIRYRYIVVDNEIYFNFDSEVTQRYDCKPNEIQTIRSKIEKSFYFFIIGTELSLYGPNDIAQMKLTRVPIADPKSLSGEWLNLDVSGSGISESLSISDSQVELCAGKGVVGYSYNESNKPSISFKVLQTAGCIQNEIYSALSKSVYMRWYGSVLVYLYNTDFEEIMTIRRLGDKIVSNSTVLGNASILTGNKTNNNTNNGNNNTNNGSSTSNPNVNNNTNNNKTSNQNTNTQSSISTPSNTQPNTQNQNNNQIQSNQTSNQPTTSTTSNTNNPSVSQTQSSVVKYLSISDLPSLSKSDFQGKWTIKDSNFDFTSNGYFFLILPDKIMLYGGCNVYFTTYSLNQCSLSNTNVVATSKVCPELTEPFKSLIEKFKSWKYLALKSDNSKITLQILDSSFTTLNNLEKIA